jgi:hypothetical protein
MPFLRLNCLSTFLCIRGYDCFLEGRRLQLTMAGTALTVARPLVWISPTNSCCVLWCLTHCCTVNFLRNCVYRAEKNVYNSKISTIFNWMFLQQAVQRFASIGGCVDFCLPRRSDILKLGIGGVLNATLASRCLSNLFYFLVSPIRGAWSTRIIHLI